MERRTWLNLLLKIVDPVINNLSNHDLKKYMPITIGLSHFTQDNDRIRYSHLEAFARTLNGIAPWLENTKITDSEEETLRKKYLSLVIKCINNGFNPKSHDFFIFTHSLQELVEVATLAQGILRAPTQIWDNLDSDIKDQILDTFNKTKHIKPCNNNFLLFPAIIEIFFHRFTGKYDHEIIKDSVEKVLKWYKGDGVYGDGPNFHWDYYNSICLQPMLLDIIEYAHLNKWTLGQHYPKVLMRIKRFSTILERMISPEGTFPVMGRSISYRTGIFHSLVLLVLKKRLPECLPYSQVRTALTVVITKLFDNPNTFDPDGWLKIGLVGNQPNIAENYISTGSLYMAVNVFLPLGLDQEDPFWKDKPIDWTSKRAWSGSDSLIADRAID